MHKTHGINRINNERMTNEKNIIDTDTRLYVSITYTELKRSTSTR